MERTATIWKRLSVFLLSVVFIGLSSGCSSRSDSPAYSAMIAEAQKAASDAMSESNASAIAVALVDEKGILWTECQGEADSAAGKPADSDTLFGIGSVSKMFATIAVMQLVEKGSVELDKPLTTYLKEFRMTSPEYSNITVRMLLNHSSGLPGGDTRNCLSDTPFTGFAAQMMEDLKYQRLKHAPGYLNVYSNDGFTMVENLVKELTGLSYPEYVRRNILTPVQMTNSRYPDDYFPPGFYAVPYTGRQPQPYTSLNIYASGGLYSTAAEMGKLMMMLINGGAYGTKRILSPGSIAEMSQDQTLGTFNPAPTDIMRYGLGWDTVGQAGLKAVGIRGWQKGGSIDGPYGTMYRSTMIVAPDVKLGVVVMIASNKISSDTVDKVGERVLLAALVDRGVLTAMPARLPQNPLPVIAPTAAEKSAYSGFYAASGALHRLTFTAEDSLTVESHQGNSWTPKYAGFRKRNDGWYAADGDSITALRLLTSSGRSYIEIRTPGGAGHYASTYLLAQKLEARGAISAAWLNRRGTIWLPVNNNLLASFLTVSADYSLMLTDVSGLAGYLLSDMNIMRDMDPQTDNRLDGMFLQIPHVMGRDLVDAAIEVWEGSDWLRVGSKLYRSLSGIPSVPVGPSGVTIGSEGFAEWRKLPPSGTISINNATAWRIYGSDFNQTSSGKGNGSAVLPGSGGVAYLILFGASGAMINLNLSP